jgi:hypothetical protein
MLLFGRPVVMLPGVASPLVVKLSDVDSYGRSLLITGGIGVSLDPTAYRVPAGHRLRLSISGGAFPRLWPGAAPASHLSTVDIQLPVALSGQGKPATVPQPVPASRWIDSLPVYEILEEPLASRVRVVLGDALTARLPDSGVVVESLGRVTNTVHMAGSAHVHGSWVTTAVLGTGEAVRVEVRLRLTPTTAHASGRVSVDGAVVAERDWRA